MALPNWAGGAAEWAKGHRAQAIGIGAGVVVALFLALSGGEGPGPVDPGPPEDDLFGAGALPEDVTTASALNAMQARMEQLSIDLGRQRERDDKLEQALRDQGAMLATQIRDQERGYTEQLETALEQAISLARRTERRDEEAALEALPALVPTLRILRPDGGQGAGSPAVATQPPGTAATAQAAEAGGPWVRLPLGATVTGELLTGAFATKARGDALPVLVQLRSAYTGPNGSEIPLEDCLVIGKATADISSVRARVEAVSLSCVLPDGTAFERQIKWLLHGRGRHPGGAGSLGVPQRPLAGEPAVGDGHDGGGPLRRRGDRAGARGHGRHSWGHQHVRRDGPHPGILPGAGGRDIAGGVGRERHAGVRGDAGGTDHRRAVGRRRRSGDVVGVGLRRDRWESARAR